VAITVAEPCIISMERCARSNQAVESEAVRRLMIVLRMGAVVSHFIAVVAQGKRAAFAMKGTCSGLGVASTEVRLARRTVHAQMER
jgi:hypothetical protein